MYRSSRCSSACLSYRSCATSRRSAQEAPEPSYPERDLEVVLFVCSFSPCYVWGGRIGAASLHARVSYVPKYIAVRECALYLVFYPDGERKRRTRSSRGRDSRARATGSGRSVIANYTLASRLGRIRNILPISRLRDCPRVGKLSCAH